MFSSQFLSPEVQEHVACTVMFSWRLSSYLIAGTFSSCSTWWKEQGTLWRFFFKTLISFMRVAPTTLLPKCLTYSYHLLRGLGFQHTTWGGGHKYSNPSNASHWIPEKNSIEWHTQGDDYLSRGTGNFYISIRSHFIHTALFGGLEELQLKKHSF